jgi:hypothetical protein
MHEERSGAGFSYARIRSWSERGLLGSDGYTPRRNSAGQSRKDYLEALLKGEKQEINTRFENACRRLFGQVGLDFDRSLPSALIDAFFQLVTELPQPWLKWLQSNLQEACRSAPIGNTSSIPLEFFSLQLQRSGGDQAFA